MFMFKCGLKLQVQPSLFMNMYKHIENKLESVILYTKQ